jgi:hypothetical protein
MHVENERNGRQPHLIGMADESPLAKIPTLSIAETDLTAPLPGPVARMRLDCVPAPEPKPTGLILNGTPCRDVPQNLFPRACDRPEQGHFGDRASGDEALAPKGQNWQGCGGRRGVEVV